MNEGIYKYFLNNQPGGVVETFRRETLPDGAIKTVSERDARFYGTLIFVEAIEKNDKFQRFEIRMTNQNRNEIQAAYEFSDNEFRFTRICNGEEADEETIVLPENAIVFPLMRVFQGKAILQVAASRKSVPMLVPSIENPLDAENLLKPIFDERRAEKIGEEAIGFYQPDSAAMNVRIYRYITKHYDENQQFFIDENGLLVAYKFQQAKDKIWNIILEKQTGAD